MLTSCAHVLQQVNILMTDKQFSKLMQSIDVDGDGVISYNEFIGFCRQSEASSYKNSSVSQVSGVSVDGAIDMIRAKISERLEGGPSGLRRAFQFFDADGSGTIDVDELAHALKMKTMLIFDPQILQGVYDRFDSDGTGITCLS